MSEGKDRRRDKEMRDKNQNIQVFVRVRPMSSQEKQARSPLVVETPPGTNKEVQVVEKNSLSKSFNFDRVFGTTSKQVDVYKVVAAPLVEEVLLGYNCTVFAYGQTGTGKTFTMEGERHEDVASSWENDPLAGIIPRTLSHLFDELRIQEVECTVRVSFIEIYNEDIYDLLSGTEDTTKLRLFDDTAKKGSVIIQGMEEVTVHNKNEVYSILAKGSLKRQTAATLMNAHSSRSHTIFSITVHIKENTDDGEELMKIGKLNLVDLAGSENIGRSGAVERRAREAGNINQSLLTLGRVITSLVERAPHIPYRESKLTRLLQDSLGGRTKTSIIATVSPAAANLEETLSTLDYAHRAKNITNRPEVNQKLTKKALLKEYTEEIERLRRDLLAAREKNGVYMAQENYEQITREIELQRKEIVEKLEQIKAMEEEQARKEEACNQLQSLYDEQSATLHATTEELNSTKANLTMTRSKLKQTRRQRDEKGHLIAHHVQTEKQLGTQARELLKVADVSTDHVRKLHSKLDRKRSVEKENERINQEFRQGFASNIARMEDSLNRFVQDHTKFLGELSANYGTMMAKQSRDLSALSELMSTLVKSQSQFAEGLRKSATDCTHSTQEFAKLFLGTTRAQVNTQVAGQGQFLADQFLPKFQTIIKSLQEQGQAAQKLQRTLTVELQQQADLVNVLLTEQKDGMNRLRQVAQQWDHQTDAHLRRASEQQTMSSQALSDFDAESNKQLQMIINMVSSIQQTRENFKSRMNETASEASASIQKAQEERSQFYHVVETTANDFVGKGKELRSQLEAARSTLLQTATASLEKAAGRAAEASKTCAVIEGDVNGHVTASQAAWNELYSAQEADLIKHSDHLNGALLSHAHLTTDALQSLHVTAQTQEALLEEQRVDMTTLVRERQDDVEAHSTSVSDWGALLGAEIKQRNNDVVKFLVEDIRQDVPTGQTPQRRDFTYQRFLAATSPHDRILERFRQERGEEGSQDDDDELSADEAAEFSQLSRRSTGKGSAHSNQSVNGGGSVVHRSASMNDLTDNEGTPSVVAARPSGHRSSSGDHPPSAIPIHRTHSVEGSLNSSGSSAAATPTVKENKENFAVPQDPAPQSGHNGKKQRGEGSKLPAPGRKILNAQNAKAQ